MSREEAMHHDFDGMTDEEIALLYAPEILSKARTAWSLNHQA